MDRAERHIRELLVHAGVAIDGDKPYDIKVYDDRLYKRVLRHRELGLGEAYMDGWWGSKSIDQMIARILESDVRTKLQISPELVWAFLVGRLMNRQTINRAADNASHHYDIGNDLFERMLGKRMAYSCGYWRDAKTLDEAQEAKLDLVCRKLHLKKGMRVLDIGCGWGSFAAFAAQKYGVHVTGITPAAEQAKLARKRTKGLDVKILQKDYRHVSGVYDRIVSIGMLEHVGDKNYPIFFRRCREMLRSDGLMLHHVIGSNYTTHGKDPWIDRYIFPGGHLPSLAEITKVTEHDLIIEDVQNFGPDYDKTLMTWHKNFIRTYSEISGNYDERFKRMWEYYLLSCAGLFRARRAQLYQVVLRPVTPSPTYIGVR